MHEDWEPWVRRLGIAALVALGLVLIGLVGRQVLGALGSISGTYRAAEQQSDTN